MTSYLDLKKKDLKELLSSDKLNLEQAQSIRIYFWSNHLGEKEEMRLKARAYHIRELEYFEEAGKVFNSFLSNL